MSTWTATLAVIARAITTIGGVYDEYRRNARNREIDNRRDAILADPVGEWMRKFKPAKAGTDTGTSAGERNTQ